MSTIQCHCGNPIDMTGQDDGARLLCDCGRTHIARSMTPDPEALGFILRRWIVSVQGYGDEHHLAPTRGKALAEAWRGFREPFPDLTFIEFKRRARCRLDRMVWPGSRFGHPITVGGKPAFFVGSDSQYVQIAYPGGEFTLNAHPLDVKPIDYRPRSYRSEKFDAL